MAPRLGEVRHANVAEDALDGLRRDPHLVNPLEPDLRPAGPTLVSGRKLCGPLYRPSLFSAPLIEAPEVGLLLSRYFK
jgi:hypothetical protein